MGILTSFVVALLLATAPPDPQAMEQEAKQIETMLIAPCCWMQQVSLHQSPASDEIKANIRRLLAQSRTRQQILDAYVAEYGDRILAEPPARGFSAALYVLPWFFLAGSIGVVVLVVRRLRAPAAVAQAPAAAAAAAPLETGAEADRLDEELRNLD
ncbi:MAG: cytochrome c-type biogenesis protein CcmH [Acidobacteriota bacterium]